MSKILPFSLLEIQKIIKIYPTPFYIYDEQSIISNAQRFQKAFSILPNFKEYFAVKALPNPHILKILKEQGFGADCSSLAELLLSEKVGIIAENIMFTSNDTPLHEFQKAKELGAIINLDDITHIDFLDKNIGLPDLVCLRYNPGLLKDGNEIIGNPQDAKYGFTRKQIFEGYVKCKKLGVKKFGLHTMVCSNERNEEYFIETAKILFELAIEIRAKLGINLEFVNLGGGIGIPYKPEEKPADYDKIAKGILQQYNKILKNVYADLHPRIYLECGRVITGPYGYLVTSVLHQKHIYKNYIGLDACMANLMRPALYGAYHHITVMRHDLQDGDGSDLKFLYKYDVVGSLCENNDKFAIDRFLPEIETGDILVVHDVGAHGHAMGFQYNGKLRSAELLLKIDGKIKLIRRAETMDDYFGTLDFHLL